VHLKSTHGKEVMGIKNLTAMVIDEISLLPLNRESLDWAWPSDAVGSRRNVNIYVSPSVPADSLPPLNCQNPPKYHHLSIDEALHTVTTLNHPRLAGSPLPRFDLAIISTLSELDLVLRPDQASPISLVRTRGAILLLGDSEFPPGAVLHDAVARRGVQVHTSRCGSFAKALSLLKGNGDLASSLETLVTHRFPLQDIEQAFEMAKNSAESIKVIVETGPVCP